MNFKQQDKDGEGRREAVYVTQALSSRDTVYVTQALGKPLLQITNWILTTIACTTRLVEMLEKLQVACVRVACIHANSLGVHHYTRRNACIARAYQNKNKLIAGMARKLRYIL